MWFVGITYNSATENVVFPCKDRLSAILMFNTLVAKHEMTSVNYSALIANRKQKDNTVSSTISVFYCDVDIEKIIRIQKEYLICEQK